MKTKSTVSNSSNGSNSLNGSNGSKENTYLLSNADNYFTDLDCTLSEIADVYSRLILEYIVFVKENLKIKNNIFLKFIIIRGLDTITNVFNHTLFFTKNLNLTYYHCQKSFYLYIEFVGQITEIEKMFLELSTRDATLYVYKKTVYDINKAFKKESKNSTSSTGTATTKEDSEKMDVISNYIKICQMYLLKMVQSEDVVGNINNNSNMENLIKLNNTLKNFTKTPKFEILEKITDHLYYLVDDLQQFYEINKHVATLFMKNSYALNKAEDKWESEMLNNKLSESSESFVKWLVQ